MPAERFEQRAMMAVDAIEAVMPGEMVDDVWSSPERIAASSCFLMDDTVQHDLPGSDAVCDARPCAVAEITAESTCSSEQGIVVFEAAVDESDVGVTADPRPEPQPEIEYVYDWEAQLEQDLAYQARENLIHEISEAAIALNIDAEGRFAEGVVYSEDQLVDRLLAQVNAPQAIEGVDYLGGEGGGATVDGDSGDPLAAIPVTDVTVGGMPRGPLSGWLAANAQASQEAGGVVGAVGHMANGMAAGVVSLFDVVVPRCAADLYSVVFCGRGIPEPRPAESIQTREAAAFASAIYGSEYNDDGAAAGGLLGMLGIPYNPRGGLQAALFRGESGTFYLVARGTDIFTVEDWVTNVEQACGGRPEAYEAFIELVRDVNRRLTDLGGSLVCAGHSMGGALAIAAARASGAPAEAFNPAYVNATYSRGAPAQIRVNVVQGDALELYRHFVGLPAQGEMHYYRSLPGRGFNHSQEHFLE